jgi:hypothetical protein
MNMTQFSSKELPEGVSDDDKKYLKKWGDKLSDSTRRSRWIGGLDEHADHDGESLVTRNHDVIMKWAEERGAVPATVGGTEHGDRLGVLRFDFEGGDSERLEEVSWDEWFKTFDERNLVMIFQENLKNGNQSNFFRLDNPEREDA